MGELVGEDELILSTQRRLEFSVDLGNFFHWLKLAETIACLVSS